MTDYPRVTAHSFDRNLTVLSVLHREVTGGFEYVITVSRPVSSVKVSGTGPIAQQLLVESWGAVLHLDFEFETALTPFVSFENGYHEGTIEVMLAHRSDATEFMASPFVQTLEVNAESTEVPQLFLTGGSVDTHVECKCGRRRGFADLMEYFHVEEADSAREAPLIPEAFGDQLRTMTWLDVSSRLLVALSYYSGLSRSAATRFSEGCYALRHTLEEERQRLSSSLFGYLPAFTPHGQSYIIARWVAPTILQNLQLELSPDADSVSWSTLHHLTRWDDKLLRLIELVHRPRSLDALIQETTIVSMMEQRASQEMAELHQQIKNWETAFNELSGLEQTVVEVKRLSLEEGS